MLQRHIVALIRAGRHVVELRRGRVARFNLRPPRNHFRSVVGLDVAPMGRANREHMRARLAQHVVAADAVGAQEGGQIVAAVGRTALGERGADERLQRGEEVDLAEQGLRFHATGHTGRPAHDEWHGGSALESAVFVAAERTGGTMTVQQFLGLVLIAIVNHGAIVARENDERVVGKAQLGEGFHDFAHRPVELHDGIAAQPHLAFAAETCVGKAGHVDIVGGKI